MKIDISDYFDDKTLVIIDIDSVANKDFVSSYMGNKGGKPSFSFKLKEKEYNSTIVYPMLSRIVNSLYYINDVDIQVSFDTKPNFLDWLNKMTIESSFEKSNEYFGQLGALRRTFKDMNINVLEQDGMESSSLIVKSVKDNYDNYDKIVVYTRDKVLYRLVDDKVSLVLPSNKYDLTINNFKLEQGVSPELIDYKHLFLGDSTLNLKGVSGVGNAKFNKLISEYDSTKTIIENIKNTKLLKDNQKEMGISIYEWLLPSVVNNVDTMPTKINKNILKQFLEFYECNSLMEKVI